MRDPVDDVIDTLRSFDKNDTPENREQLRKALVRWMRREIRRNVLDGEGYA